MTTSLHDLAAKLIDFAKDYDFYTYQDSLEVGETDEDAIKLMAAGLVSREVVEHTLTHITGLLQEDLTDEQRQKATEIIRNLNSILEEE